MTPDRQVGADRLHHLMSAVVALSEDQTLDRILQRVVDSAAELVGARYGFLGVLDGREGRRLGTFAVHGLDEHHQEMIGRLPQGEGLLGMVIDNPHPLRVDDLHAHPERAGFPQRHPTMSSFLGVPIRVQDRVFGNLYLTEKTGGTTFTAEDEQIAVALASAAGAALETARLWEEGDRQRRWLQAATDLTSELLGHVEEHEALYALTSHAKNAAQADAAAIAVRGADGTLDYHVRIGVPETYDAHASKLLTAAVDRTGGLTVTDQPDDDEARADMAGALPPAAFVHVVPATLPHGDGLLILAWSDRSAVQPDAADLELATSFVRQAALVTEVVRAREDSSRLAVLEDRDRIGRDLHDLVIQRVFAVGLGLDRAAQSAADPALAETLASAVDDLDQTVRDIRRTIFDLKHDPRSHEPAAELTSVVNESSRVLGFHPGLHLAGGFDTTLPSLVRENALLVLREALSNVARHARATTVDISVERDQTNLQITVRDDGTSSAAADHRSGSGLANMRRRAEQLGGTCTIELAGSLGTTVTWTVPIILSGAPT